MYVQFFNVQHISSIVKLSLYFLPAYNKNLFIEENPGELKPEKHSFTYTA